MAHGQQHFFRRFVDVGTGKLPANATLNRGRYLVIQTVGKGGMGAVYLARDTQMGNELVALKEMSQGHLKDAGALQQARQRFQQEADMLRQLRHPHLPQIHDSFQEHNRSYLVMDYIQGKTLFEILKQARGAALATGQVVDYGLQLCDVLTYLHKHIPPIIFRDLKPSNILIQDDGQLFLIDFGIARFLQQTPETEAFATPGYAPPEQYGGQSTPRSDLFSLGATLHYCLTGHNPQSNTQTHRFDFKPVDFFNPQAPPELCALVQQMVEIKPEHRPARVDEVQRGLQEVRKLLANPLRLSAGDTYDPNDLTYNAGAASATATPRGRTSWSRILLPLAPLGSAWASLSGGIVAAHQAARSAGVGNSLRTAVSQWWARVTRAVKNWSWDPRVWTPRFVGVLLTALALILGGSLYLLKTAPDAPHLTALVLIFGLLCLLGVNLTDERLRDPVLRSILGLMGLGLFFGGLALQALPDMVSLEQQHLPLITLNQVCALLLLLGAVVCLLRPSRRFAWVDHLQLGCLAGSCALLQYGLGFEEVAQFPELSPHVAQFVLPALVWGLAGLALLALFRYRRPYRAWSRFTLLLIALAFAPLQYVFGYNELQHFLAVDTPSQDILLHLAQINVFCVFVPLACALLAFFTRPVRSTPPDEQRPGRLTRLALFLLTLVVAALLNELGQGIKLPLLPANAFPLSITMLAFSTLYQLIEPLLALITFVLLLRLFRAQAFTWLDHAGTLGVALIGALFDSAYWQAQAPLSTATMDQNAANQQFTFQASQLPADFIYILLLGLFLGLIFLALGHFRGQSHPSTHLDKWLKGLQTFLIWMERLLILALVAAAFILQIFFGPFKAVMTHWGQNQLFVVNPTNTLALLTVSVLILLGIFCCLVFARFLAPSRPDMGSIERWTVWLAAVACLLLAWQDPQISHLPLLTTSIQLTGNLFHWPVALLYLIFIGGLLLAFALARLWLRRGFFTRYRELMQPSLLLALLCVLLQLVWPIFLPLGLIILSVNVLLASQIEKTV